MSADNYSKCPVCMNQPSDWRQGLEYLYGVVSVEQYESMKDEYRENAKAYTVREDCEYGIDSEGCAYVNFSAICTNCKAKWHIKVEDVKHGV